MEVEVQTVFSYELCHISHDIRLYEFLNRGRKFPIVVGIGGVKEDYIVVST